MSKFENHENYNCKILTDTGEIYKIYANWLHNQGLDNFKGWTCHAGNTRFYIDKNDMIWSGECRNDLLGNVFTDQWNPLEKTTCQRETCTGCTDDLMIKKYE